jgi:hypothetical protein
VFGDESASRRAPAVRRRGRRGCEERCNEQADWNRDHEAGVLTREQDLLRAECVEAEEASGGHEREREQQYARVATPVGAANSAAAARGKE